MPIVAVMLPEEEHAALLRATVALEKDMEPNTLVARMIATGIFNDEDVERVQNKGIRRERVWEFLMLYKRKARSLEPLKKALHADGLEHLVAELNSSSQTDGNGAVFQVNAGQLRNLLNMGGVPGILPRHVERTAQLRSLGDTLVRNAAKESFWVVLHGMAGCGKTTLCSDVLRSDSQLIGAAFQSVIWVKCDEPPADFQSQKLFKVLHNLHTKLGTGAHADAKFDDVETALHFVRQIIHSEYPKLLIVLDDVWSADVVRAFDSLQCRILTTTRIKSLFNVATCQKEFIATNPVGFTKTEALNVLGQYANCKPSELPSEASAIFQLCNGHPLVINLIGSLIREHEDRWHRYYEELKNQNLDGIEHKTSYHSSTFYKAAKISCDDLTPDQLRNFSTFAIFPLSVPVPDAVLAAIWPGDAPWTKKLIKVQDDMIELRDRSLIEETVEANVDRGRRRRRSYSLHYLLHAYLKRFPPANQKATQTLCRDLVEKLQAALHNQTNDFPDYETIEEFFYVNLGYFFYKANLRDHFPLYFLNLDQLIRRLKWSTPSAILVEFHVYNRWISHWDPPKTDAFLKFFRRNASHLRDIRNKVDAVQLSLAEAPTSPVYEQAKTMAVKLLKDDPAGSTLILEPSDRDIDAEKSDCLTLDGYVVDGSLFVALFLDQNARLFVACSRQNRHLLVCDARSGQTVQRMKLSGIVDKVSVCDRKSLVVSFCNDSRVLMYDVTAEPIVEDVVSLPDSNAATPSPVLLYLNGDRNNHHHLSVDDDSFSEDEHTPTAFLSHRTSPLDCAISPNGRRVAILLENSLVVHDRNTSNTVFERALSAGKEDRMAFIDENIVLVGHLDGSFDMVTETNTTSIRLNNFGDGKVRAFAVLGNQFIVGDWQRRLFLRRLHDDWQTQTSLPACVASSYAIATSPTTGLCAVGLTDCSVLLFRISDGNLLLMSSLRGHGRPVQSVHFADYRLISTADDDTVVVWKISRTLTTSGKLDKFATMTASQRCADRFVAASLLNDGSFMVRSSSSPARDISPIRVIGATCMAVAAAASLVAFGTERNTVEIYSQSDLKNSPSIVNLAEAMNSLPVKLAMTTDGAYIVVVGRDGKLALASLRKDQSPTISSHSIGNDSIVDVQFYADGSRLLIATDQRLIRILRVPSMETVTERRAAGVGPLSIVRHVSTSQVLFADDAGVVGLIDLSLDASFVKVANYSTGQIVDLCCSPCLRYILCLSYDAVLIYDRNDKFKLVASVACCDGSAVFSSDNCEKVFLVDRQTNFRVYDRLKHS